MSAAVAIAAPIERRTSRALETELLVRLALRYLDRGHAPAFVATALGTSILFVTQVEAGAAMIRRERRA